MDLCPLLLRVHFLWEERTPLFGEKLTLNIVSLKTCLSGVIPYIRNRRESEVCELNEKVLTETTKLGCVFLRPKR